MLPPGSRELTGYDTTLLTMRVSRELVGKVWTAVVTCRVSLTDINTGETTYRTFRFDHTSKDFNHPDLCSRLARDLHSAIRLRLQKSAEKKKKKTSREK